MTERWSNKKSKRIVNHKIDLFIQDVISVCKKHGYSISREDYQGGFEIEPVDKYNFNWLRNANDNTND